MKPTPLQVERLIRSAIAKHEANFCARTFSQLTPEIIEQIDILLNTDETNETQNEKLEKLPPGKLKTSDFAFLKTD